MWEGDVERGWICYSAVIAMCNEVKIASGALSSSLVTAGHRLQKCRTRQSKWDLTSRVVTATFILAFKLVMEAQDWRFGLTIFRISLEKTICVCSCLFALLKLMWTFQKELEWVCMVVLLSFWPIHSIQFLNPRLSGIWGRSYETLGCYPPWWRLITSAAHLQEQVDPFSLLERWSFKLERHELIWVDLCLYKNRTFSS